MNNAWRHTGKIIAVLTALLLLASLRGAAQPIPAGDLRGEQFRLRQLWADSLIPGSFSNRPIWMSDYRAAFDSSAGPDSWWNRPLETISHSFDGQLFGEVTVGAYEPVVTNTFNSELPWGENNGAAWYGRGHNREVQAGVYLTSDWFTVTLRPHFIRQQNRDFPAPRFLPLYPDSTPRYVMPGIIPDDTLAESIDLPWRFGNEAFTTSSLGETSIRVHYGPLEAGLSNESLWWGPAVKYPLTVSNNAEGLNHIFVGTRSPVPLPLNLGELEFRWIWARPRDSDYFDLNLEAAPNEINRVERENLLITGRYMNGLNLAFSPSAVPGLHLGLSRAVHGYMPSDTLGVSDPGPIGWKDYTAVFRRFPRPPADSLDDYRTENAFQNVNPLSSVWFRWVFPEAGAELYGEFYKENHNRNSRDLLTQPQHGRGYTVGGRNLIKTPSWGMDFFRLSAEINSLLPNQVDDVRPQSYIYSHDTIKQGHTNRGQVIGAAIGPGGTSQYLALDAFWGSGQAGVYVQRMVKNDHFHYEYNERVFLEGGYLDQFHHRVDLNIGLRGKYRVGPLLAEGEMMWNRQYNYGRTHLGDFDFLWHERPLDDVLNFHWQLRLRYLFR